MKKIFLAGIILVICASTVSSQQYFLNVWVDRGCGANYKVGDKILVYYDTNVEWGATITIWERQPDGTRLKKLNNGYISGGSGNYGYVIQEKIMGRRAVEVELISNFPYLQLTKSCEFNVVEEIAKNGTLLVSIKDQNGSPLANVTVLLDGQEKGKTDASGRVAISNVNPGNHTIEVSFSGKKDTRSVYVSEGTQPVDFLFSVVKEGRLSLVVKDLHGNPVSGASITVDGSMKGVTDSSGTLSLTLTSGNHTLLVSQGGKEKSVTISIKEGQSATTEILLETAGKMVTFSVKDKRGTPIPTTQIFVDYILKGTTNAQGTLQADVEEGSHLVTASKEGYSTFQLNATIEPDETVDIVITEAMPYYLYGGIAAAVILLLLAVFFLMRRKPVAPPVPPSYETPAYGEEKKKEYKEFKKPSFVSENAEEVAPTGRVRYCKICHGALDKEQNPYVCECTQVYHRACAQRQMEVDRTCPACGKKIAL